MIEASVLPNYVRYNPDTGELYWLPRRPVDFNANYAGRTCAVWNARYAGEPAFANRNRGGYLGGYFLGGRYLAHRVAWCLHTGAWPSCDIDHIDGDVANNRFANLRLASKSQNQANRSGSNTAKGVSWSRQKKKWRARIGVNGKSKHLGYFDSQIDAQDSYNKAALKHFGEFAKLSGVE